MIFCLFLQIISPYNLYLNPNLVIKQYQLWRLVTNFLYFRKMGNSFMPHSVGICFFNFNVGKICVSLVIIFTMMRLLRRNLLGHTRLSSMKVVERIFVS